LPLLLGTPDLLLIAVQTQFCHLDEFDWRAEEFLCHGKAQASVPVPGETARIAR
jgi:hypothetical protein